MRFEIIRASDTTGKSPPTDGAVKEGDEWFIEVASLDVLTDLIKKEGTVIVSLRDIWIYDDYME